MDQVRRLGAAAAVAALVLGGCGDGGEPEPGPSPSSADSPSAGDTSPSESDSTATPSVPPATGDIMRLPGVSVRAPEKWEINSSEFSMSLEAREPEAFGSVFLSQVRGPVTTLEGLIETGAFTDFQGRPKVSFDAELGGEPAFRAVGQDALGPFVRYGAVHGEVGILLSFGIDDYIPTKQRQRIEDSVVATFEWR